MTVLQPIEDSISALTSSISDAITRITASAGDGNLTPEVQNIVSQLNSLKSQIDAIDPTAPAPVTP